MDALPTREIFEQIAQIKLRESHEKTWLLSIATQANRDERGQREMYAAAEKIGKVGGKNRRKSAFDVMDDDAAKIRMIGSAWASAGERWAAGHAKEVKWLRGQGITLDEAAERFQSWWDEKVGDGTGKPCGGPNGQPGEGVSQGIGGDGSMQPVATESGVSDDLSQVEF